MRRIAVICAIVALIFIGAGIWLRFMAESRIPVGPGSIVKSGSAPLAAVAPGTAADVLNPKDATLKRGSNDVKQPASPEVLNPSLPQ